MINIDDILTGNFESYSEEIQKYMKRFQDKLREQIKNELIKTKANALLKELERGEMDFILALSQLLEDGFKGYKNISFRAMLNMYLENGNEENFLEIIEEINLEMQMEQ